MDWSVDPDAPAPASQQLVERCLAGLARGALTPGDRLPSVRGLAALALVNHNTVARAYRELEGLGVVKAKGGSGVYVTARGPEVASRHWQEETEGRFRDATRSALDAGHAIESLIDVARGCCAPEQGEQSA